MTGMTGRSPVRGRDRRGEPPLPELSVHFSHNHGSETWRGHSCEGGVADRHHRHSTAIVGRKTYSIKNLGYDRRHDGRDGHGRDGLIPTA